MAFFLKNNTLKLKPCILFFGQRTVVTPAYWNWKTNGQKKYTGLLVQANPNLLNFSFNSTSVHQTVRKSPLALLFINSNSHLSFARACLHLNLRFESLYNFNQIFSRSDVSTSQRRYYSHGKKVNEKGFDPNEQSRRQKLMLFTYLSCFIGVCLLSVIGFEQYGKLSRRAVGMEDIKIREYGVRARLFRYRGYVFPDFIVNDIRNVHEFAVREDDVWIASFPKAGTTWVQEIVYLISSDLDFTKANTINIDERCPYFEFIVPGKKAISVLPSPRLIKTHLPFSLLPREFKEKRPKIIYVMRNPKDTVVSYHRFATEFLGPINTFQGTFERYCELFTEDLVAYGPWWKHVLEAWKHRDKDNVLVISYEDMQKDLSSVVRHIAEFLGRSLNEEQVNEITRHCSFENMKKNSAVNYTWLKEQGMAQTGVEFMRKGKVGDWREHLSDKIIAKLDDIVSNNLAPSGVVFQDTGIDQADMR